MRKLFGLAIIVLFVVFILCQCNTTKADWGGTKPPATTGSVRAVPNVSKGYNFYHSTKGYQGRSVPNHSGGYNFYSNKGGMVGRTVKGPNGVITFRKGPGK